MDEQNSRQTAHSSTSVIDGEYFRGIIGCSLAIITVPKLLLVACPLTFVIGNITTTGETKLERRNTKEIVTDTATGNNHNKPAEDEVEEDIIISLVEWPTVDPLAPL